MSGVGTANGFTHSGGGTPGAPSPSGDGSRPQVQKAALMIYDSVPTTGGRKLAGQRGSVEFQFNPKEVTLAKSAKWKRDAERNAKKSAAPQFQGAEPCKLSLEMFLDATGTHDGSVVATVEKLFDCCVPTAASQTDNKAVPPLVTFVWGSITSFPAFISSVSAKYTLFSADGTPIRAICTVQLEEMPGENGKQNPTSGSLAVRRVHTVIVGDSLASVAYATYGDPTLWRALADFNDIDDPLRVPIGTVLLLPTRAELSEPAGSGAVRPAAANRGSAPR